MDFLDIKTLVLSYVVTSTVSTVVMFILWRQNRTRFKGAGFWFVNFLFQTIAFVMIALRGKIPDLFSMGISNILVLTGVLISILGLEKFLDKKRPHTHDYIILMLFSATQIWFSIVQPDLSMRNLNISVTGVIFCTQAAWLMLFKVEGKLRKLTKNIGFVMGTFSIINCIRIIDIFFNQQTNDYFNSGLLNALALASFQMLFIFLNYSLILMFNGKLMFDISAKESELVKKIEDLERFNRITVDRELKMIELKKEINELLKQSGKKEKYIIAGQVNEK